jgi:hypothetical protein
MNDAIYKLSYLYMVMTLKGKIARQRYMGSRKSQDIGFHIKNLLSLLQYELKELILKACRKITNIRWLTEKKKNTSYIRKHTECTHA